MSKPVVEPKHFWTYPVHDREGDVSITWLETALGERALQEGLCLHNYYINGTLAEGMMISDLTKLLEGLGLGLWMFRHKQPSRSRPDEEFVFLNHDTAIFLSFTAHNSTLRTSVFSLNDPEMQKVKVLLRTNCENKPVKKGKVFVLVSSQNGITLQEFGVAGEDFIESNYRPDVVEKYRHIVKDLNDSDPCGRIAILDGPPGTGKTHMVRALLNEVPEATFILVQVGIMTELGNPSFISVLMDEQRKNQPMVLVLEDADECLSSRKADNVSAISALLNFSDGIFGALLDMRIVATTNVDMKDLDRAVMRPGRLCRRIEVGKLDAAQAREIHTRIKGESGPFVDGNFYTLGEVYSVAKGGDEASVEDITNQGKKLVRMGFQINENELEDEDDSYSYDAPAPEGCDPEEK